MATGKRKADALISDHREGMTKQARVSVGGKSQGLPLPNGNIPASKPQRQTQRQPALTDGSKQAAIKKHPMVLHLEEAHNRMLQETMDSIGRGASTIQLSLTDGLATQSDRTYESLKATLELFNDGSYHLNGDNRTTAAPMTAITTAHLMPALKKVVDEHTEAVSRIATDLNQWTLQLLSALVGTSLNTGRTLSLDNLSTILAQQQYQNYRTTSSTHSVGTKAGEPMSPMSPTSPSPSSSSNGLQRRQPLFKFDRRATTIRRILEECQRYKLCKYEDRYLGYDKGTQFHSYRAEERYIQARLVVFEEVRVIMETRGLKQGQEGEEEATVWLEKEFLKMDVSTSRFLEILKEKQKLRKSDLR